MARPRSDFVETRAPCRPSQRWRKTGNSPAGFVHDRRSGLGAGVDQLAPEARPAKDQLQCASLGAPAMGEAVIAFAAIDLQDAFEAPQPVLGVSAVSAGGIGEDDRWGCRAAPETAGLGLSRAGVQRRQCGLIGEELARALHGLGHARDDGAKVERDLAHPVGEGGPVDLDTLSRQRLRLAVKGRALGEFADRDVGRQRLGRQGALDQRRGGLGLNAAAAPLWTGLARPDGLECPEPRGDDVETLRALLFGAEH